MTRNLFRWFVLSGLTAAGLLAQGDRGTITGTVTDSSGQVVPNAEIVILNEGTGIQAATKTGDAGTYTIPLLSIGNYALKVSVPGFKSYIRQGIAIQVGQTTRVDLQLEVGQVEEKITVNASAPMLTTDTSEVGVVVNQDKFLDLPLALGGDFRRASSFIFLSPGVSGSTWEKHIGGGLSFTDAVYSK